MATLLELRNLRFNVSLLQKVEAAVMIAADTVYAEATTVSNHTNRLIWAKQAMANPAGNAQSIWNTMLAANDTASEAVILASSDASIQSNVDSSIDLFADGS